VPVAAAAVVAVATPAVTAIAAGTSSSASSSAAVAEPTPPMAPAASDHPPGFAHPGLHHDDSMSVADTEADEVADDPVGPWNEIEMSLCGSLLTRDDLVFCFSAILFFLFGIPNRLFCIFQEWPEDI
jgi:hypothetical protein